MNPQHQKADTKYKSMNDNEPRKLEGRYNAWHYALFMFCFIPSIHILKAPTFVSSLLSIPNSSLYGPYLEKYVMALTPLPKLYMTI